MSNELLNIAFVDENTIRVSKKTENGIVSYLITDIENDKASISVINEIKKISKILNSSVLKTLDKTQIYNKLKADKLNREIQEKLKSAFEIKNKTEDL